MRFFCSFVVPKGLGGNFDRLTRFDKLDEGPEEESQEPEVKVVDIKGKGSVVVACKFIGYNFYFPTHIKPPPPPSPSSSAGGALSLEQVSAVAQRMYWDWGQRWLPDACAHSAVVVYVDTTDRTLIRYACQTYAWVPCHTCKYGCGVEIDQPPPAYVCSPGQLILSEAPVGQRPSLPQQGKFGPRTAPLCGLPTKSWDREESGADTGMVAEPAGDMQVSENTVWKSNCPHRKGSRWLCHQLSWSRGTVCLWGLLLPNL